MPNTKPATTTAKLLEEKRKLAAAKCLVNYGFHFGATANNIGEIKKAENIAAVKVYMGSTTGSLLVNNEEHLKEVFCSGRTIAVHAENDAMINQNEERFRNEKGGIGGIGGIDGTDRTDSTDSTGLHLRIRSSMAAAKEVERAIRIARQCKAKLHICHISTKEETGLIAAAKKSPASNSSFGSSLSCEVTPHHLFLTAESAKKLGNYAKVNPPLRAKEDVAALWQAIAAGTGIIDMIATDHAPHTTEEKEQDYWNAPSGMPGLETMLPLLLDAVNKKRMPLQQLISLTSANPAAVFGIKGKGKIALGFDADIALIDLKKQKTIKNSGLLTKCGWTPFDGWKVKGAVAATVVNGRVVYDNGAVSGETGNGKEVKFT
ncbi:amidohydrolase family protein, partial [Candidatus Woesearchaeota archaeon]|nr:amidohydrolase family protein [Candidatus Woesearchaeota archaeon]